MKNETLVALIGIMVGVVCWTLAWVTSISTIAGECDKLGGFYVGAKVYTCEIKK